MPTDPTRVKAIFLEAAELPDDAARAEYLDRACAADAGLRERVEALFRSHDPDGSFLGTPVAVIPDPDQAVTRAFSPDADATATRPGGGSSTDDEVPLGFLEPATRPDSLGRIGHYEVLQVIGQGGFGIVFRAFDEVLHRVVAVKVLAPQLAATSPARKRFLREARSAAQVRHENVVQVYEVGETPLPYIAMEFIPGETLQERLKRVGPVDPAEVVRVGRQVAEGLAAAHTTDLIHRDIKPGNVLLEGGAGRVKITDFGLARAADDASISQSGIIAGTPMYMAPEQAKGETLDQRADLFSLGSVLYQMACGRPPFRANGTVAVLKRVAEDTPRDIREIVPEVPQWLCDIISKLHAKDPADRYQSAREVADVLADCEAQLKANAKLKDFSRIPRSARSARAGTGKWKWVAAAVLLLPVIALAVTELTGVTHLFRGPAAAGPVAEGGEPARPADAPPPGRVALEFDGTKDCVATPLLYDGSTPLTVEATVQISEWPVRKKQYHGEIVGCTEQAGFGLGTSKEGFYFSAVIGTNYATVYSPKDDRYLNRPIKLAGIIEAKALRLFIDGKQVARSGFEHEFKPSPERISLGTSPGRGKPNDGNGYDWAGKMFEVRISNTVRYGGDYDASVPLTADGSTLAFYRFDEGSGDVLHDTSGNGRHGNIVGARWVNVGGAPIGPTATTPSTFTNGLGMEFVIVPKGKSWLGGGKDKPGDQEVNIPADFYLGKYEVTQEEWEKVMGANPSHFSRTGEGKDAVKDIPDADLKRFPVERVSWDDCQIFVAKLNQREKETGWVYRLPKEAEWEYACRGGPMRDKADSAFDFYFAQPTNTWVPNQANLEKELLRTCKVGLYEPNRLGLSDMHGNVWEWCDDSEKAGDALQRVARGGCWLGRSWETRSAVAPLYRSNHLGLRLARVPSGVPSPETKTPPVAIALLTDAEVKRITALPAEQQVEEVRKELIRRNPGFDGKVEHKIEDGIVTELRIVTDQVTDIAPIRAFNALRVLNLGGTATEGRPNGRLADLTPLRGMSLSGLTMLSLANTRIDDTGLSYFKDCKNLEILWLNCAPVTNAGVALFKDCTALKSLTLNNTRVDDAGLAHFKDCKGLTGVDLGGLAITDAGLANFKDCKGLTHLVLYETGVTNEGLAHFKDCKDLTFLHLRQTGIGDAGLAHFKDCKKLTWVELAETEVTDACLTYLAGVGELTHLNLAKAKVTAKGVEDLAKALPKCKIEWDGGVIEPK